MFEIILKTNNSKLQQNKSCSRSKISKEVQMYIDAILPDLFLLLKKFQPKITKSQVQSKLISDWKNIREPSERAIFSESNLEINPLLDIQLPELPKPEEPIDVTTVPQTAPNTTMEISPGTVLVPVTLLNLNNIPNTYMEPNLSLNYQNAIFNAANNNMLQPFPFNKSINVPCPQFPPIQMPTTQISVTPPSVPQLGLPTMPQLNLLPTVNPTGQIPPIDCFQQPFVNLTPSESPMLPNIINCNAQITNTSFVQPNKASPVPPIEPENLTMTDPPPECPETIDKLQNTATLKEMRRKRARNPYARFAADMRKQMRKHEGSRADTSKKRLLKIWKEDTTEEVKEQYQNEYEKERAFLSAVKRASSISPPDNPIFNPDSERAIKRRRIEEKTVVKLNALAEKFMNKLRDNKSKQARKAPLTSNPPKSTTCLVPESINANLQATRSVLYSAGVESPSTE